MNHRKTPIEHFSESYYVLPDVDVQEYSGDFVVAPEDLFLEVGRVVGWPLTKVGGSHYWLDKEWGIPPETIAVPGHLDYKEGGTALVAKRAAAEQLVDDGVVEAPPG